MMSLHKFTAGDGYCSLARQVATREAGERGFSSSGACYGARGEAGETGYSQAQMSDVGRSDLLGARS
ncbi:hypothetical protein GCM10027456_77000 [Kineosporia babensis]